MLTNKWKLSILLMVFILILVYIFDSQYPSSFYKLYKLSATQVDREPSYFPLKSNLFSGTLDITNASLSTDPTRTTFYYDKNKKYKVGDEFTALITARNYLNQIKSHGGDFFQVVLLRSSVKGDGVAAKIVDHGNGSYSIRATLLWEGKTEIRIVLVHSSEAVQALKLKTSEQGGDGLGFTSTVTYSAGVITMSETVDCGPFLKERRELCNISGTLYGEPWFCFKPSSGCATLVGYERSETSPKTRRWRNDYKIHFMQKINWQTPIKGSDVVIKVANESEMIPNDQLPGCNLGTIHKRRHVISGHFLKKAWVSNVCDNHQFTPNEATHCLANSSIIIMGDSTARQFFEFLTPFLRLEQLEGSKPGEIYEKKSISRKYDIDISFYVHGPPIQNAGEFRRKPYMSQTINNLKPISGKRLIIFSTFGLHILSFRPSYFRQRVVIFKKSILELQKRIPNVVVVVKKINFHYEVPNTHGLHQWLCHRMNRILEEELDGLENAVLMDTWDMTLVQPPFGVHPDQTMIRHQTLLALSYLCSREN